jgi:hypothetical protein
MEYLYTIRIPFKAMDDLEARNKTKELEREIIDVLPEPKGMSSKLQEVFTDKPPRGISL